MVSGAFPSDSRPKAAISGWPGSRMNPGSESVPGIVALSVGAGRWIADGIYSSFAGKKAGFKKWIVR